MKKILIIGGTGFIGYSFGKFCLKKNWSVTSVSLNPPKKNRYHKKIKYLFFDISKKDLINKNLHKMKFNYVVNCGGNVDHKNKIKVYKSHYLGLKYLTEYFVNKKIESFIQIGSSVEYGKLLSPHREINYKKITKTNSYYGDAKLKSTNFLISYFKKYNFPCKIIRVYLCYGPGQDYNRLIPVTTKACLKNKKFECSSGIQSRDFIFISDLVSLIYLAIKNKNSNGEIFNAGNGKPYKLKYIINLIKTKSGGGHPNFGSIKLRKDESLEFFSNIKKSTKILKWRPKIKINEGIDLVIKSLKKYV